VLASYSQAGALIAANNLSDVNNSTTSRANLGAAALAGDAAQAFSTSTAASSSNTTIAATTAWAKFGFAVLASSNGYLKFPTWLGGLVLQWGSMPANTTGLLPLAWPTAGFVAVGGDGDAAPDIVNVALVGTTQIQNWTTDTGTISYFAIGH
jgi:hypothetical protein